MITHTGNGFLVDNEAVIGIFDIETSTEGSDITNNFLKNETDTGNIIDTTEYMPQSFIVTENETYICQLNTRSLKRRMEMSENSGPEIPTV